MTMSVERVSCERHFMDIVKVLTGHRPEDRMIQSPRGTGHTDWHLPVLPGWVARKEHQCPSWLTGPKSPPQTTDAA